MLHSTPRLLISRAQASTDGFAVNVKIRSMGLIDVLRIAILLIQATGQLTAGLYADNAMSTELLC